MVDMVFPGRIWHYFERALLLAGLALLAGYAAGVIDSALRRHHGLTAFADARADATVAIIAAQPSTQSFITLPLPNPAT